MSFKGKPPTGEARRVRSTGDNLCGVITNKRGRQVQFESWLERGLILRLDRDREVLDFQSQPETFSFVDDEGQSHRYTPDFKVWRLNRTIEIHEVTLTKRRLRVDIGRREQAARTICLERGWRYVLHTEQTLPDTSEQANLLALAGYRPLVYAHPGVTDAVSQQLAPNQPVALTGLIHHLGQQLKMSEDVVTAALCHLLWHGDLLTDLNRLLFADGAIISGVQVWLGSEEGHDEPSA